MTIDYDFSYLDCQTCHAKINCGKCQDKIGRALLNLDGVISVDANVPANTLVITAADSADVDEIEDVMDNIGVLI